MSDDTDDPEGFDREAQRRELREKYAADREDRERTGRMSELLLQGATMTNKHCDRCGNPIFRYDGAEFCPTCRAEDDPDEAAAASADVDGANASAETAHADGVEGAASGDADGAAEAAGEAAAAAGESPESHEVAKPPEGADEAGIDQSAGSPGISAAPSDANAPLTGSAAQSIPPETADAGVAERTGDTEAAGDDVAAARAALSRSVARLAERAASADPHAARELAEAAREAAEALAALDD